MPPKILRRCTVCKQYGAAYQVPGKGIYCYDCWKKLEAAQISKEPPPSTPQSKPHRDPH
jgi:hypothetical protein